MKERKKQRIIPEFWRKEIGDWWLRFQKGRRLEEEHVLNFKGR